jgi:hypothetical protein
MRLISLRRGRIVLSLDIARTRKEVAQGKFKNS